jgi:hypothetical protein
MIVSSRILPDPWCFVSFDDFGGRLARVKDHIGEEGCGPGSKTLCGRPLQRWGYPIRESEPDVNFFCRRCVASAERRGWRLLELIREDRLSLIVAAENRRLVEEGAGRALKTDDLRRLILDERDAG